MSVYINTHEPLSHPIQGNSKPTLTDHLLRVASKAYELLKDVDERYARLAFYAGILHDIGKLNPLYQEAFREGRGPRSDDPNYLSGHSVFSAYVVQDLLNIPWEDKSRVLAVVHGHHSSLKPIGSLWWPKEDKRFEPTLVDINRKLPHILEELAKRARIPLSFKSNSLSGGEFSGDLKAYEDEEGLAAWFNISLLYSALLQADRGSFNEWSTPTFNLSFETAKLVTNPDGPLAPYRTRFYNSFFQMNKFPQAQGKMFVLQAPTGIGKTRIFLEIINRLRQHGFERVFYFSPLLALTDDFENKLSHIIRREDFDKVLSYNYTFQGSLAEKKENEKTQEADYQPGEWRFEVESFNYPFIVTTTQRLLMMLFSPSYHDKLKLLSLKHSILVIDEVQTIPHVLLPSLLELLGLVGYRLSSTVLLVSATVPPAASSLPQLRIDGEVVNEYLEKTCKRIKFEEKAPDESELPRSGRTLVMFNTRRKAAEHAHLGDIYLTSGVRKKDRLERLHCIRNLPSCRVVSTQVIEAGVDISFDHVYREVAPLDSIVQMLGRLNREGEQQNATLVVFGSRYDYLPYGQLEYKLSHAFLHESGDINSLALYKHLTENYYPELDRRNKLLRERRENFEQYLTNLEFQKAWDFVRDECFREEGVSILIPDNKQHAEDIIKCLKRNPRAITANEFQQYVANFPGYPKELDLFDNELIEHGIFVPLPDRLAEIYDFKLGLDKNIPTR
ncbi:MAG: CRISPR-associated helicase Cas3' [Candidatus Micrarchaeia archaeon]